MDKAKLIVRGMLSVAGMLALMASAPASAGLTDLATAPLATSSGSLVRPNILFTLDNSGSMAWDFLPDYTGGGMGTTYPHCKASTGCKNGLPPFQASQYNGLAYNPAITYGPPANFDGTLKASQTCVNTGGTVANCTALSGWFGGWTAVKVDGYGVQSAGTINLTTGYPETFYCNGAICKQNGVDNNNPFFTDATGAGNPNSYAYPGMDYNYGVISNLFALGCPWCAPAFNGWPTTPAYVSTVTTPPWLATPTWQGGWPLNGVTNSTTNLFSGILNNGSPATYNITLNVPTVSRSGGTITVNYTSQSPVAPVIVSGDTITVSGGGCGTTYIAANKVVTVASATKLTYSANGTSGSGSTVCTAVVKHTTTPVVAAPSISSNNITVTVKLASLVDASGHTLVAGDIIQVTGVGCDAGYRAVNAVVSTVSGGTTLTYLAQSVLAVSANTTCTISRLVTALPPSPGISINGNVVTVTLNGCCATGAANQNDYILRSPTTASTGDYIWPFCSGSAFVSGQPVPITVKDANTFTYNGTTGGTTDTSWCWFYKPVFATVPALLSFNTATNKTVAPYEYVIIPVEYCDSQYLTNCVASSVPTGAFTFPAPVRYCSSAAIAALTPGNAGAQISGGAITCQGLFSSGGGLSFTSARYGLFYRINVTPAIATYGDVTLNSTYDANGVPVTFGGVKILSRAGRTDCAAAPNCTYAEEMTNFANWYAYYRTRMQMMKTSAGKAFLPMDTHYRIGFATINESWVVPTTVSGGQWLPVSLFDVTQKQKWYNGLYSINPNSSTPLREAVARAGRYFAGLHGLPGDAAKMTDDPMEYSCQENYLLITTDGYWNGTTGNVVDLTGAQIGNTDNNPNNVATTRGEGVYDGAIAGASTTLADTAAYYYLNDLRKPSLNNCTSGAPTVPVGTLLCTTPAVALDPLDNVPVGPKDPVSGNVMWQHMVTFSLGMASGLMLYQPDYEKATNGDFSMIKTGANGCPFSGAGICNWPLPAADSPTALDDLWHAAVNGRGTFYNARDPVSLSRGLSGALSGMNAQVGASAASATSSPNITQTDRAIFSSTYRTAKWDGEVVAQLLDPTTGNVPPATLTALTASITSIALNTLTVVVNMPSHGLLAGDMVQVANTATGTCDPAFNTGGQSVPITVLDANNFTYPSVNSGGATLNTACQIFLAGISWSAQKQLDNKVLSATEPEILTRLIYTDDTAQLMPLNTTNTLLPINGLKEFRYSLLPAADQALFDNHCTSLLGVVIMSQCTAVSLTAAQIASANSGYNLINYLRGNQTLEQTVPNPSYRPRDHFLGDTVNARPAYVRAPTYDFQDAVTPTYASFKAANQTRLAILYIASNDGMLHAFGAGQCTSSTTCSTGTGNERWAYVPHETLNNLYKLADVNYGLNHQYFVDGSPEVMDIFVDAAHAAASGLAAGWHTILVAGLNGGGRGFYALDITDPTVPVGLWDICASGVLCSNQDSDLGYSYGNPVITKRSSDGKWVALFTSGYNNVTPGTGQGFLYVVDAITGTILQKIPTGSGSVATPSGLAKIAAWADNGTQNNTSRFVYGGDMNGDVWRFDLGAPGSTPIAYPALSPAAMRFTTLYSDAAGTQPQPITTRPELGDPWTVPGSINSLAAVGKPAIFIGTGRYLGVSDLGNTQKQTIYALKDDFSTAAVPPALPTPVFPAAPAVPNPRSLPVGTVQPMVVQTIDPITGASSSNPVDWSTKEGWYADFPTLGERNNLDPQLLLGTLIVVTNVPTSGGACLTGGTSYMYQFNFRTGGNVPGSTVTRTLLGNAISVGFVAVRLPSGQLKVIVTNAAGQKSSNTVNVTGSATTRNVSWRELLQ